MTKQICLFILVFLFFSCSDESAENTIGGQHPAAITKSNDTDDPGTTGTIPPGPLYASLYETYVSQGYGQAGVAVAVTNVESVAMANPSFLQLIGASPYTPVSVSALNAVLSQAYNNSLLASLQLTSLSDTGKQKVVALFGSLSQLKVNNMDYDAVNTYLLSYDQSITGNGSLTGNDIEIILTTTSILNNGFYAESKKRRRDRDWELSVGHIAATTYGADLSPADAITYSLAGKYTLQ